MSITNPRLTKQGDPYYILAQQYHAEHEAFVHASIRATQAHQAGREDEAKFWEAKSFRLRGESVMTKAEASRIAAIAREQP